jgi:dihydrofolate reductase
MRKLTVFNHVSLDGYFADSHGDMSWAHKQDPEWTAFAAANAKSGGTLVFGRVTYQMMASYWPTPAAMQQNPDVAKQMTALPKIVFSKTLSAPTWQNTRAIRGDIATEMQKLKRDPGTDMVIMGSGTIVAQLAEAALIDAYQLVLNPVVLGGGRTLFDGIAHKLTLKLTSTRAFENGNVVLSYEPS